MESYIREHARDFINGVDTNYIKNINIDGMSYNTFCHRLSEYCDKKRVFKNGKKIMMYFIKPDVIQRFAEAGPLENKTVKINTEQTESVKKKIIKQELKEFFRTEYQELPFNWKLKEYYNYYNNTHVREAPYEMFLKQMPTWDLLILC